MPLLPPIELIPDSEFSRRVTKKRRLESPDRTPLERPLRKHCSECNYMLPNFPVIRPQHRHRHPQPLDGEIAPITIRAPATLCDTASIQDPVTPPRRPVPLENEPNHHSDDEQEQDRPEDDQQKRRARKQLPWLYRKTTRPSRKPATGLTHSRTSSPCSSTDSLPLITPSSSYQSRPIPLSIASSSSSRSIFGASPLSRDMPFHWAEHQDSTPIWADAWDDDVDMDMAHNGSDLIPWDYPSSSTTPFDPVPLDTPTPSASTTTSRTPRARARQSRHSTRSYQPYWSVSQGRANMRTIHARPTPTRSAALETAQSTLPSWMRSSNINRPSWRHSLIGTCSSPNETDKDRSPPLPTRPVTPPMKFSTSSFHLSALKLR